MAAVGSGRHPAVGAALRSSASRLSFRRASSSGKLSLPADGDTGVELTGEVLLRLSSRDATILNSPTKKAVAEPTAAAEEAPAGGEAWTR